MTVASFNQPLNAWPDGKYRSRRYVGARHGDTMPLNVPGSGSRSSHNGPGYTFSGKIHMHYRCTDFDNAATATPEENTQDGWQQLLDGIYPIITSTDFNSQATASGATLQMSGGPTKSGKYLRRRNSADVQAAFPANNRLRNFNLSNLSDFEPYNWPEVYVSFYLLPVVDVQIGKAFRIYWEQDGDPIHSLWTNYVVADNQHTWNHEWTGDADIGGYSDQNIPPDNGALRVEILMDYANTRYLIMVNGIVLTDVSNGYNGWIEGKIDADSLHRYALLGNTVEPHANDESVGWAMPVLDFSLKRIMLADTATWGSGVNAVFQPCASWDSDNVEIIVNQGHFADLQNKHLFYLDGATATYIGELPWEPI